MEQWLEINKIRHFYSRKGTPYDNARIESFHASLKKKEVNTTSYSDFEEANRALFSYFEVFYNRNRIHSSVHYLTPQEFEELAKAKMEQPSLLKCVQDIDSNPIYLRLSRVSFLCEPIKITSSSFLS